VQPATRAVGRRALQAKPLRELGDQRAGRRGAQIFVRRARDEQIEVGPIAASDRRGEDPPLERHLHPVIARRAAGQHGAARQARDPPARDVLIEPRIVGVDTIAGRDLRRCRAGSRKARNN